MAAADASVDMMVMISMENYYYSIVPVGGDHPRRTAQDRRQGQTINIIYFVAKGRQILHIITIHNNIIITHAIQNG